MPEKNITDAEFRNREAIQAIQRLSGVDLHDCYQCGKCTAGCPMADSMDMMPRQVIRHLQLGLWEDAVNSKAPWICATCHVCTARCPHDVNISELMETVRQVADREGIRPVRTAGLLTYFFMLPVRLFGKSHEVTLTAFYNVTSGRLLQHFSYLPKMLSGGKLKILPERVKDRQAVRRLIENCEREANKE